MSNTEEFEGEVDLDAEFGGEEGLEAAPAGGDEFGLEEETAAAAPPPKKSGGAGKFLFLLLLLGLGGGAGAVKLDLVQLPFDIPGLTPERPAAVAAQQQPPAEAQTPAPTDLAAADADLPDPNQPPPADKGGDHSMPSAIGEHKGEDLTIRPPGSLGEDPFGLPPEEDTAAAQTSLDPLAGDPLGMPDPAEPQQAAADADPFADMGEPPAADDAAIDLAADDAGADPLGLSGPDAGQQAAADPVGDDPFADMGEPPVANAGATPVTDDPFAANDADPFAQPAKDAPRMDAVPVAGVDTEKVAQPDAASMAKVAELEKKVAGLEKDLKAANDRAKKAEEQASRDKDALQKAIVRAEKAEKKAAAPVKAAATSSAPKAASSSASKPAKAAPAPRWVLKSAKPGVAWVALPGSVALKTVAVGDTLAGIGKVKAVAKNSAGRWVVSGTQGNISQ